MKVLEALYRLLLLGLERETRRRHGDEMLHAFARALSDAREQGSARAARTAAAMLTDLTRCALADASRSAARFVREVSRSLPAGAGPGRQLSLALRRAQRSPIASVAIVASVALSTGAATGLFAVADSLLLRPLPVHDPDRLVLVAEGQRRNSSWPYPIWKEIERARVFDVAAWDRSSQRGGLRDGLVKVEVLWVSGGYFELLGLRAHLGRLVSEADAGRAAPVAVLSHRFWRSRFGGDTGVLGRSLVLDEAELVVVGVAPEGFGGIEVDRAFDVAVPYDTEPLVRGERSTLGSPYDWGIRIVGRLGEGDSPDAASARLRAVQPRIKAATLRPGGAPEYEAEYLSDPLRAAPVASGVSWLGDRYGPALWVLLGTVGLLVALAATNTASLLAARVLRRRTELGVHSALGATPFRIAAPILLESLLLTGAGVALGQCIAAGCSRYLLSSVEATPHAMGRASPLELRVVLFAVVLLVAVAAFSGLVPALRAARTDPLAALRGSASGERRGRLAGVLVANQLALSLALLIVAGLAIQTFLALAARPLGFDGRGLLVAKLDFEEHPVPDLAARLERLVWRAREAVLSLPEAGSAAGSLVTPLSGMATSAVWFCGDGGATRGTGSTHLNFVTPGWFATYRTRLVAGRDFLPEDADGGPGVAIVNRALAEALPCDVPLLGAVIHPRDEQLRPGPPLTIVGIVEDAVYRSYRETPPPTVYRPWSQVVDAGFAMTPVSISVRPRPGAAVPLPGRIEAAIRDLAPGLSVEVEPFARRLEHAVRSEHLLAVIASGLALLGALLAVLGTYGVVSHEATGRQREAAIRVSLGASTTSLWLLALRRAVLVLGVGLLAGEILGFALGRAALARIGATLPATPLTYAGTAALLAVATLAAVAIAAGRAVNAQPSRLLRETD